MFEVNFREISYNLNKISEYEKNYYCHECENSLPLSYDTIILRKYCKYGLSENAINMIDNLYKLKNKEVQTDIILTNKPFLKSSSPFAR